MKDFAPISLQPPPALGFEARDGRTIVVSPATRERLRVAGEEDATAPEEEKRARVLAALVGPRVLTVGTDGVETEEDSAGVLATLTPAEELAWIATIQGQAEGIDPATALAMHKVLMLKFLAFQIETEKAEEAPADV